MSPPTALESNPKLHEMQSVASIHVPSAPYVWGLAHSPIATARHVCKDSIEPQRRSAAAAAAAAWSAPPCLRELFCTVIRHQKAGAAHPFCLMSEEAASLEVCIVRYDKPFGHAAFSMKRLEKLLRLGSWSCTHVKYHVVGLHIKEERRYHGNSLLPTEYKYNQKKLLGIGIA
jgi:hypothetical protein